MKIFSKSLQLLVLAISTFLFQSCERSQQAEVKKVKIGDIELAYYTRGQGEPLVMIIGFRGTMAVWDPGLLELLEKKYKLILFDNRGAGLSSDTAENQLTISQMAEDTAQLIKALELQKVHVLGWSMGSIIALELSLKYPDVVDHLILCSPNPGGRYEAMQKSNAYQRLASKDVTQEEVLSLIFPATPIGQRASNAFVARVRGAIIKGTVPDDLEISEQAIARQVQALIDWSENNNIYEALSNIKMPTLVAGGLDDALDSPENVQIVASRIPFAWTAYFAGAGHDFLSQEYQLFADLLTVFLESTRGGN